MVRKSNMSKICVKKSELTSTCGIKPDEALSEGRAQGRARGRKRPGGPEEPGGKTSRLEPAGSFVASQSRARGQAAAALSSVQVLGVDLFYRPHHDAILFKTEPVLALLGKALPLAPDSLSSVVGPGPRVVGPGPRVVGPGPARTGHNQDTLKRTFISWKALRAVLDSGLLDLAIRDSLLATKEATDAVPTIAGDTVVLSNTEVKFKVRNSIVYLDVLSAFAALDRLHDALNGTWAAVDGLLAARGIAQKTAFKKRGSVSGRSYMTLEAFMVLAEDRAAVAAQAGAMLGLVEQLVEKKNSLCKELGQTVEMIVRTGCITPREGAGRTGGAGQPTLGHRHCGNVACGRGYHFVLQCCGRSHTIELGDTEVGYVRKDGRVFLEKCAAFGSLGRMAVIRCSDYRKADKLLAEAEAGSSGSVRGAVERSFLFEQDDPSGGRNRRTHISLDAFTALVSCGFPDPSKVEALQKSLDNIKADELWKSCDPVDEIIDLSESDAEVDRVEVRDPESSGPEWEGSSPPPARRCRADTLSTSEDDSMGDSADCREVLGQRVGLKVSGGQVYLERAAMQRVLQTPLLLQRGHKTMDRLLEESGICLDEAFIYEGRQRGFVSTSALKAVLNSESMMKFADRDQMLGAISDIEQSTSKVVSSNTIHLNSCGDLKYRAVGGSVYLDLAGLIKSANLFPGRQASANINVYICKILSDRGVDIASCFLRQGKSKYAYISAEAGLALLRPDPGQPGPSAALGTEIREALAAEGLPLVQSAIGRGLVICRGFAAIQYKIVEGCLYLHRKSCFEMLNLESAIQGTKKGLGAVNSILESAGLDPPACYLAARNLKYSYISCLALVRLLESKDPLMVCLARKEQFLLGLLAVLQTGPEPAELVVAGRPLPLQTRNGALFLHRRTAFTLSGLETEGPEAAAGPEDPSGLLAERGLEPADCFLPEGEDRLGWISLPALSVLLSLETEAGEAGVSCRDLLSAVALQEPRLRQRIQMDRFRAELLGRLIGLYCQHLAARDGAPDLTESSEAEAGETDSDTAERERRFHRQGSASDHVVPSASCPASPALSSSLHSPLPACLPSPTGSTDSWSPEPTQAAVTAARYQQMKTDILSAAGGVGGSIGDWEVVRADCTLTRLRVRPGYGASRKVSFLRPDYAAILSYSLAIGPGHVSLTLNDSAVPADVVAKLLERGDREGTLSFLYQLISLRPCFGSFSPELVETVRQWDEETAAAEKVYIDSSFIGTSGSGRTYAGTVRTLDCGLIASDRVSDCCLQCRQLARLTINRSLLGEDKAPGERKPEGGLGAKASQKSVWQLATTTEDACSFVCPQVQSFNTSLPHAFNSASQATAVVEHRAEISNSLVVEVHLSGHRVARRFPEFQQDRQLGPLLDWVAGLRLCVGYPANQLVKQAEFLKSNLARLRPELQRLFERLQVDPEFRYSEGEAGELEGTIRAGSCLAAAEPGADICHQCRLLQEPIEFLGPA